MRANAIQNPQDNIFAMVIIVKIEHTEKTQYKSYDRISGSNNFIKQWINARRLTAGYSVIFNYIVK